MDRVCCLIFFTFAILISCSSATDRIQNNSNWELFDNEICGESFAADRIIGGKTASLGQYPWLAQVGYLSRKNKNKPISYTCGGSLINLCWVLTAGHCIPVRKDNYVAKIRLGEFDTTKSLDCQNDICADPVQEFYPARLLVHNNYNPETIGNDIALIKLHKRVWITQWVRPICLPTGSLLSQSYVNKRVEAAGWGMYKPDLVRLSDTLQTITLTGVDLKHCSNTFPSVNLDRRRQLCVGGEEGFDTCSGDSGGPLMVVQANPEPRYYIVGIVSFGTANCALAGKPAVYTNVSSYMNFILNNVTPCKA